MKAHDRPGGGWSRPNGNGRGRWSRPVPRGSRSAPWPRRSGCHPPGCTRSWPPPTWTRWTQRSASCGRRAGPPRKIRIPGRSPNSDGRDNIAGGLSIRWSWLRQCAGWLAHLDADGYPPAVSLRPSADWPDRAIVAVDLARVGAVINRVAADVDELARARRPQDLDTAAMLPDPRAERRRRLAEPDLEFRAFCTRTAAARFLDPATGAGLGRLAGRAIPARRDQPTTRLHRQPVRPR